MNENEKIIVYFDAVPINTAVDPRGGYAMKMKEQQMVSGNSVFEEVVLTKTLPFSAELLEFAFECVLTTMAERVSRDCRPRKVGKHLKAAAYLRGRLDSPYGSYDPKTHSCAIIFTSLSGVTKTANTDKYVRFVNTRTGTRVTIDRIVYEGCVDSSQIATIMRGKGIAVTGLNCQWLEGDTCTLVWTDADGVEQTANIEPLSSTVTEMHFAWPEALDAAPTGPVQMKFLTRGGNVDGEPQANDKTVTLIEGIPVPLVTGVTSDGADGVAKGQPFAAVGSNLGFNFATDHASVEWVDPDGTPRQAALVPVSATPEKIAFSANPLFNDLPVGTALDFTFELGGKRVAKASEIAPPPGPAIHVAMLNSSADDWAAKHTTWMKPGVDETYDNWFDTADGEPTLAIVTGDRCVYSFAKDGETVTGDCVLENKGDDEMLFKIPVSDAAKLEVNDVVSFRAELHGGEAGTAPQFFEWTSTVVEE